MDWIIEYDICALILLTVVFWILLHHKNFPTLTNRMFRLVLTFAWLSTLFDLIGIYTIVNADRFPLWLNNLVQAVYLSTFNSCGIFYYVYVLAMTQEHRIVTKARKLLVIIPAVIVYLLIFTSPFTHFVFYFDDTREYCHGAGLYILYAFAFYFIMMSLYDTMKYKKLLTRSQKIAVITYTLSCVGAFAIQLVFRKVMLIAYAIAISSLMLYLSLQNPDDFIDKPTGAFNTKAFLHMLSSLFQQRTPFTVLCLEPDDFGFINKTLGIATANSIIVTVARFLQSAAPGKQLYRLSGVRFALILDHKDSKLDDITSQIFEYFGTPYLIQNIEIKMDPLVCAIHYPENASYLDDFLDAIDYSLNYARKSDKKNELVAANETALIQKRRDAAITHIIKRAIQNREFEVHFQPVYSVKEEKYIGAEALVRLQDKALGDISPSEFIPIAERSGSILDVSSIVIETVCSVISENRLSSMDLRYISINLSVVQCMQKNLAETLLEIIHRYNVPAAMLRFEVTEAITIHAGSQFEKNMRTLADAGCSFILDDYGIGYSNGDRMLELPFREVKISKEILWLSVNNVRTQIALKNTIAMFLELKLDVVAEGAETKEHIDLLSSFGIDYIQGFYYAKPLPAEQFLSEYVSRSSTKGGTAHVLGD